MISFSKSRKRRNPADPLIPGEAFMLFEIQVDSDSIHDKARNKKGEVSDDILWGLLEKEQKKGVKCVEKLLNVDVSLEADMTEFYSTYSFPVNSYGEIKRIHDILEEKLNPYSGSFGVTDYTVLRLFQFFPSGQEGNSYGVAAGCVGTLSEWIQDNTPRSNPRTRAVFRKR